MIFNQTASPLFAKGNKSYWGGLYGSSQYLALLEWVEQTKKVALIIANDANHSHHIIQGLSFYGAKTAIINFLDYEVLPYDSFSAHEDSIATRLQALIDSPKLTRGIIVVTLESLIQRLCPTEFIKQHNFQIKVDDDFRLEGFKKRLIESGYHATSTVREQGEFSVRGSLLDLYPVGTDNPFRLDIFDDSIESIRIFDEQTQRTIKQVALINILPAKEFSVQPDSLECFKQNYLDYFGHQNGHIFQEVSQGRAPGGIEFYLPLFFNRTQTLFDYLPQNTTIVNLADINPQLKTIYDNIQQRYTQVSSNESGYFLAPKTLFLLKEELFSKLARYPQLNISQTMALGNKEIYNFGAKLLPALKIEHNHAMPLDKVLRFLNSFKGRVLLVSESLSRQGVLLDLLAGHQKRPTVLNSWSEFYQTKADLVSLVGQLDDGFIDVDIGISVITEKSLFGEASVQQRRRRAKHKDFDEPIKNLVELNINDAVVHEQYGIGRYLGLKTIEYDEVAQEFITLAYANEDKLMVPISELTMISRYAGSNGEHTPLHRLGSEQWAKAKKKVTDQLHDIAADLLEIYARRAIEQGFACLDPDDAYQSFVAEFPFEETPDQLSTMASVLADMCSDKPMDRLVCGDVGFGKTEIAMRAAFLAVQSGKQVALLVPTTLLADQHYRSFLERFVNHPVSIGVLSRFQTAKAQKQVIEQLAQAKIDIVIGTHKLIQPKIKYQNLGLIVIDEEHRFGVKQKEVLKTMRTQSDILTMSATPIPRTLNMALGAIRDLSVISTPPLGRNSIKTFVSIWQDNIIIEACSREIHRAGQIFFLHNDIDSIDSMAEKINSLLPSAKIRVAHGQMPARELEEIMRDFYHQRFHILVCTTIIETGIDIPTANTIVINNAQNFGLAQLHQLRGRVGRSHHRAYAYLLTKPEQSLGDDAKKRLHAISSLEALGSGFMLANHDLEIRGSGDLLGKDQSGSIQSVGFNFYHDMLKRTIIALKKGKNVSELTQEKNTVVDTGISCIIPQHYLGDPHERLMFYKRIAQAEDEKSLLDIKFELIDRFGALEGAIESLFASNQLRLTAQIVGIDELMIYGDKIRLVFNKETQVKVQTVIGLIQNNPQQYQLQNQTTLIFNQDMPEDITRIKKAQQLLQRLNSAQ